MAKNSKKTPTPVRSEPRQIKQSTYKSFSLQKRVSRKGPGMPTGLQLFGRSVSVVKANWKQLGGIALIYGIINVIFIQGLAANNTVSSTKTTFDSIFTGSFGHVMSGVASLTSLLSTSGQSSNLGTGSYQVVWVLVISLALIWALRESYAERSFRIRDAFYNGMYPLIPFVLVLMVLALEFVPFAAGGTLFTTVIANGIAATGIEVFIWALVFLLLAILSLYMLSSSLFALYISCQPEMTPVRALRSTKQLVVNRRWSIIRKVLFLPFILIIVNGIILLPIILTVASAAIWFYYVLGMVNLVLINSYYYALYRSLLV